MARFRFVAWRRLIRMIRSSIVPWLIAAAVLLLVAGCSEGGIEQSARPLPELVTNVSTPTLDASLQAAYPEPAATAELLQPAVVARATLPSITIQPSPTNTPTITPSPTPTLSPEEHLEKAGKLLHAEDYAAAISNYQSAIQGSADGEQVDPTILFDLAVAALEDDQVELAVQVLSQLISANIDPSRTPESGDDPEQQAIEQLVADAYFKLAQAYEARGQCQAAIRSYEAYLVVNQDMQAYVQPLIASCHSQLGEQEAAFAALELAAEGEAYAGHKLEMMERLAQLLLDAGEYQRAVEQYSNILELSTDPKTKGRALYQMGWARIFIGEIAAGYEHYLQAVEQYPQAFESYLALVDLIEAEYAVDDYHRGVVDYYAAAYDPAVLVLERYINEHPGDHGDARLFLAWSLEKLGNVDGALTQIDAHIAETSLRSDAEAPAAVASAWIERAKMQARAGNYNGAIESYVKYLELFPQGNQAPFAAWWAAALSEQQGLTGEAAVLFENLADQYSSHEDASEALYRAGLLNWELGEDIEAYRLWQRAASEYPNQEFGAATLVWLLKTMPAEEVSELQLLASQPAGDTYYHLRAQDLVSHTEPFEAPVDIRLLPDPSEQDEADAWLRAQVALEPGTNLRALSDSLAADGRLIRGEKLWRLGLKQEAKQELESLRISNAGDPVASYQLALYFRDLGLYRSSILAASSILWKLEIPIFDAPPFLSKLIYPVYFAELVTEQAAKYGYDPLLQFALVRQESLFESFAQSHAAAKGLSQVIPDTGAYIAQLLSWPDYELEDLFKPYVGIAFGAYYLDQQLDSFDGDIAAALSAYNGGPGNAARWSSQGPEDIDQYLEVVDFTETREYIKRIYAGQAIYRFLYGQ